MYRRPTRDLPQATSIYRSMYSLERTLAEDIRERGLPMYDKTTNEKLKTLNESIAGFGSGATAAAPDMYANMPVGMVDNPAAEFKMMLMKNRVRILDALEKQSRNGSEEAKKLLITLRKIHNDIEEETEDFIREVNEVRRNFSGTAHGADVNSVLDMMIKIVKNDDTGGDNTLYISQIEHFLEGNGNDFGIAVTGLINGYSEFPSLYILQSRLPARSGADGAGGDNTVYDSDEEFGPFQMSPPQPQRPEGAANAFFDGVDDDSDDGAMPIADPSFDTDMNDLADNGARVRAIKLYSKYQDELSKWVTQCKDAVAKHGSLHSDVKGQLDTFYLGKKRNLQYDAKNSIKERIRKIYQEMGQALPK